MQFLRAVASTGPFKGRQRSEASLRTCIFKLLKKHNQSRIEALDTRPSQIPCKRRVSQLFPRGLTLGTTSITDVTLQDT